MYNNILIGMMLAYGEIGDYERADDVLLILDPEMWLETELTCLEDIEGILYARGFDVHRFKHEFGI